jgi:bacteriocin-like protein
MTKSKTKQSRNAAAKPDQLAKGSKAASTELSEKDLNQVTGGEKPVEYLKIKLTDVLISS